MDAIAKERQIPVGLIIAGELLFVVGGLIAYGRDVGVLLAVVGISTVVGTALMLLSAYITAAVTRTSFGELGSAVLKLAGIYIFSSAVSFVVPSGFGGLVGLAVFFSLLLWLFELEVPYAIVFTVVFGLINFLITLVLASALASRIN